MSCLFVSIGHLLNIDHYVVRQTICDYLADNKPLIEGIDTAALLALDRPDYVESMRCIQTWGGAIEIQAACMIWNARIVVENRRDGTAPIEFLPSNTSYTKSLYLYWTGGHYEPIKSSEK